MGEANPPHVANASYKERSLVGNLKAPKTSRNDRHWIKKVHGVIHLAHMHIHNQLRTACRLDASCFINLQQVCKYQVAASLMFLTKSTDLIQLWKGQK